MSVRITSNFEYRQRQPLDVRLSYANLVDLKKASDGYKRTYGLYNGLIAWVESEQKCYIFSDQVDNDLDLGYWREYTNTIPTISEEDIKKTVNE